MNQKQAVERCIRVAVVHGNPVRLVGLRSLLASESDLELVSSSLTEVSTRPDLDVILLWYQMHQEAFDVIARLKAQFSTPIVLIGKRMSDDIMVRALGFGVKGCINEGANPDELAKVLSRRPAGLELGFASGAGKIH